MDTLPPRPAVWDIVRVDFPFADQAASKRRPALVVAAPDVHADFAILWLIMITSARQSPWPFDVPVSDLSGTGLAHDCVVRSTKIAVVDARLASTIGALPTADRRRVSGSLLQVLGGIMID